MKETGATSATEDTALGSLLGDTATLAAGFLEEVPGRRVTSSATVDELRKEFGGPLPEEPLEPRRDIAELARSAEPGLMAAPAASVVEDFAEPGSPNCSGCLKASRSGW
jgi:hypothetical protein